jgi:hypothetical protein
MEQFNKSILIRNSSYVVQRNRSPVVAKNATTHHVQDRPIVFVLRIMLRKYLTTESLARAKFGAVSRAKIIVWKNVGATYITIILF